MSFGRKLFLSIFSISLLAFLVPAVSLYINNHRQITRETTSKLESILSSKMIALREQTYHLNHAISLIASRTQLRISLKAHNETRDEKHQKLIRRILNEAEQSVGGIYQLGICNLNGEMIVAPNGFQVGDDQLIPSTPVVESSDQDHFRFKLGMDSVLYVYVIEPLMLKQEHVGYLIFFHPAETIREIANDFTGLGRTGYSLFIKKISNEMVLHSGPRVNGSITPWKIENQVELGQFSIKTLTGIGEIFTEIITWEKEPYVAVNDYCEALDMGISIRIAASEVFEPLWRLRNILIAALILSSALLMWIALLLSKSLTKPVKQLTQVTRKISDGDYSQKVESTSSDEIGQLAQSFNTMIDSIKIANREKNIEAQNAQNYLNVASTAIIALDDSGIIGLSNPYSEKVLGYQTGELNGKDWFNTCVPEAIRDEVKTAYKNLINGKLEPAELYETPVLTKTRQERLFAFHNTVLKNEAGEAIGILSSGEDITERKQTEEALRISEGKFRLLYDQSPDMYVSVSPEDAIIHQCNETLLKKTGYSRKEIIGSPIFKMYHADCMDEVKEAFQQFVVAGVVLDKELILQRKDGSKIDVSLNVNAIRDKTGKILYSISSWRDITERRQSEKALNHFHNMMQYIIEHNRSAVAVHDKDMKYLYVSQNYLDAYKVKESDVIGKHHYEVFPDLPQKWRDVHQRVLAGEILSAEEDPYEREDGSVDWTRWECRPWYEEDDSIGGLIVYTEVITERKREQELLAESEHRFRFLAENAKDMLYRMSLPEGRYEYVSPASTDIFGYTPEEFYASPVLIQKAMHPDWNAYFEEEWAKLLSGDMSPSYEYQIIHKSGETRWLFQRNALIRDDSKNPVAIEGIVTDITNRKLAEEILRQNTLEIEKQFKDSEEQRIATLSVLSDLNETSKALQSEIAVRKKSEKELKKYRAQLETLVDERTAELKNANKELESFAYSVSHDLRAPLRAIDGFTRVLLEEYVSQLDAEGKRMGSVIQDNARKMGQLIDDLLNFSRVGRKSLTMSTIDMHNMVKAIYHEAANAKERKRIALTFDKLPDVEGDPNMMRLVWMNLFSNALKFSANQKQAIISISCKEEENQLIYGISDNGAGFDMKYVDKIFGVFQRLHSEKEFEGTGVGLALVQRIIHRHGGEVWAEGEVDKGAIISFSLPKKREIRK